MFDRALGSLKQKDCTAAFDPGYIPKNGKKTFGKGRFWSSKDSRARAGLKIGRLVLIDVKDSTA
ncbi:hypothetical protein HGH92_03240 [Chitinophaga varians]|uniref:Transposase IS701-like DDE domain-containing protein n=1 Tax=Chitinophaga varians TaxID=2202339 RepID=A0A847RB67_9BACT|nr:hypothetical protein [Chitinophaga varians]NLR63310.1 hypothetical protein [Chitinophaga varians]